MAPMLFEPPDSLPAAAHATGNDGRPIFDSVIGIDLSRINDLPVTLLAGRLPELGSQTEVAVTSDFLSRIGVTTQNTAAIVGTELTLGAPRDFDSGIGAKLVRRVLRQARRLGHRAIVLVGDTSYYGREHSWPR